MHERPTVIDRIAAQGAKDQMTLGLLPGHDTHADSSSIVHLARDIVCAFLAKPDSETRTIGDLQNLIQATYELLVNLEARAPVHDASQLSGTMDAKAGTSSNTIASAPPTEGWSETKQGHRVSDGARSAPASQLRVLPRTATLDTNPAARSQTWDCKAWLAKFENPSPAMLSEAESDNPNNKRGWIGVYDDHIVCLLTGRKLKILGAHLRRLFKDHPQYGSLATHPGYVEGLCLPSDYPKAAPYLSSIRTKVAVDRGKLGGGRPEELQKQIDDMLARGRFDLSLRTKPQTRPGNFPDFVVCFECGRPVHDIRPHLIEVHRTNYDRYKRKWHISGRAPAKGEEGLSFTAARQEAARQLESRGIVPDEQINPELWPGVLEDSILCLNDGKLVADLEKHLDSTGQPSITHYRARYELPDSFPTKPPMFQGPKSSR